MESLCQENLGKKLQKAAVDWEMTVHYALLDAHGRHLYDAAKPFGGSRMRILMLAAPN
jgi:hypothetical protein